MHPARRALAAFNRWFCSDSGVWQTAAITVGVVLAEATHTLSDSHGFWLLYWLTVYSAVTQPALAHANEESTRLILERLDQLEQRRG